MTETEVIKYLLGNQLPQYDFARAREVDEGIVTDKFHMFQYAGDALDELRRSEYAAQQDKTEFNLKHRILPAEGLRCDWEHSASAATKSATRSLRSASGGIPDVRSFGAAEPTVAREHVRGPRPSAIPSLRSALETSFSAAMTCLATPRFTSFGAGGSRSYRPDSPLVWHVGGRPRTAGRASSRAAAPMSLAVDNTDRVHPHKCRKSPKFYLFDPGVARRLTRRRETVEGTPEYGHLFETWVHHELRSYLDSRIRDGVVNYWRTPAGTEVDFVVGTTAVEVKSSKTIGKEDLKGLRAIAEEGAFEHRVLVCREPLARIQDGIEILPYDEFISRLWSDRLIDVSTVALA